VPHGIPRGDNGLAAAAELILASRVLLLTQVLPYPPDSGPKIKTWNLLNCLSPDYEVTLVSFVRGDQSEAARCLRDQCRAVHTVPIRRGWLNDLQHLSRSLVKRQPFLMVRDDQAAMRRLVDRVAADNRFDIVHADQLNMAQYAMRVPAARKILDAHNALWLVYKRLAETMGPGPTKALVQREWRLLRNYESGIGQAFDLVLTVSDEDRAALEAVGVPGSRLATVPIAIDTDAVVPVARRPSANHIVHIGTMYWPPNIDGVCWFVAQVYPRIRAERPDVTFDIIGARPPRQIRALAMPGNGVAVTDYVDDPTPYLERAGVMVVPLRAGGGMRVKILNALAQALPVVTTRLGCSGIAVEDGKHVLIADTPADFASAVLRALRDPDLAANLGRNGRQLVEAEYDSRVICPHLLALYRAVLSAPPLG
jgi:glycosyltransferase involved in cell wall biosynthesis